MSPPRPEVVVTAAAGGWPDPWPAVAELSDALPRGSWTLVGGLMTQLHTIHRRRIATLAAHLTDDHPAWRALPGTARTQGQLTLRVLAAS